jgi:hypothetical protein
MTVRELAKYLSMVDQDAIVVTSGTDHGYRNIRGRQDKAIMNQKHRLLYEYYGGAFPLGKDDVVVDVVVIE